MRTMTSAMVLLAASVLAAPAAELAAQTSDEAAVKAVKSVRDSFFGSYEARTPKAAASTFASDGVLMPPAAASVQGAEAIRSRLEAFTEGIDVSLQAISEQTKVLDGAVLDRGILGIETTPEGSDEASTDTGKYMLLAEKRDGTWKLVWLTWNTDHPLRVTGGEEDG